ncbi:MAG: flagellar basal body rod protein FlgC [Acidimicrobiales bacterium]
MASRWMDTIGHNISNVSTYTSVDDEPFRARYLVIQEAEGSSPTGGGVQLQRITQAQGDAPLIYDPSNPLANEEGLVQGPLVDLTGQMSDMIIASRAYQLNLKVISTAYDSYKNALQIGR